MSLVYVENLGTTTRAETGQVIGGYLEIDYYKETATSFDNIHGNYFANNGYCLLMTVNETFTKVDIYAGIIGKPKKYYFSRLSGSDGTMDLWWYKGNDLYRHQSGGATSFPVYDASYIFEWRTSIPIFLESDTDAINAYLVNGDYSGIYIKDITKEGMYADWAVYMDGQSIQVRMTGGSLFNEDNVNYKHRDIAYNQYRTTYAISPEITKSNPLTNTGYDDTLATTVIAVASNSDSTVAEQLADKLLDIFGLSTMVLYFNTEYYNYEFSEYRTSAWCYVEFNSNSEVISYGCLDDGALDTVTIENGIPDDDNIDSDKDEDDEVEDGDEPSVNSMGLLTTTYAMTPTRLQALGQVLWGASFMDNIKLVNNNPIENIVSCKLFPITITGANDAEIKIGNVETGVSGNKVDSSTFSIKATSGELTISPFFNNFLDYSPYTQISLYLPFSGLHELPAELVVGKTLKIEWVFDLITGSLQSNVYVGGKCLYIFTSNIGIDIPLSSSNRSQIEVGYITSALSTVGNIASGNVGGAISDIIGGATQMFHTNTSGNPSPSTAIVSPLKPYVLITRPTYTMSSTYAKDYGLPCNKAYRLQDLKGYTVCDNPRISSSFATESEKVEIQSLLTSGIII